ncbi:hypothetical protein [Streptomyces sp. NPDC056227]|uniref:hypothetical protein n=1 Tax=Streptomyces sp. NPDC056227 TaxID=3345753 RepID=UPI0035E3B9F0
MPKESVAVKTAPTASGTSTLPSCQMALASPEAVPITDDGTSRGEGVWTASALITEGGLTRAALSAPCPAFRIDEAKQNTIVQHVREAARQISQALSG